ALVACGTTAAPTTAPAPAATAVPAAPATATPVPPPPTQVPQKIIESYIPSGNATQILAAAKDLDKLISNKTGYVLESSVSTSFAATVEGMCSGKVDVGWLNPLSYVVAKDKCGVELMLITVRVQSPTNVCPPGKDVCFTYRSQIIFNVEKNPDLAKLAADPKATVKDKILALKGKKFAFGDPLSTSGNLYARDILTKNGLDPAKDFAEVTSLGSHNNVALAVLKGTVDAGATFEDVRTGLVKDNPDIMTKTAQLTFSDEIPNDTVSVRKDLDPQVKANFKRALLEVSTTDDGKKALDSTYQIYGFADGRDALFDPIRVIAKALGLNLEQAIQPRPTNTPGAPAATPTKAP
ncbi:MAG: phosphate/phosphite/phosphonate ABC transporter substrate-binding protein, partial [Chloroflexi bacterium]|nr:phosphate/phosphite/phosphonate ABC transporter substrate-binding protein [Chloroflexota bacterium]